MHKDLVWESNYTSGLQVLDATNVAVGSLALSASFDTYPASNANGYNGASNHLGGHMVPGHGHQ